MLPVPRHDDVEIVPFVPQESEDEEDEDAEDAANQHRGKRAIP